VNTFLYKHTSLMRTWNTCKWGTTVYRMSWPHWKAKTLPTKI